MTSWVRDPEDQRLVRSEPNANLENEPEPKLELGNVAQERTLSDVFYPPRTALPSCFVMLDLAQNVTFELKPHYTQMLPKFTGLEDAYLFLRELKEVCSMMHFPIIPIDIVRTKLNPFALKDSAKRWMYSLAANSVTSWKDFIRLFLRKYFPNAKTVKLRNEINQFVQLDRESF